MQRVTDCWLTGKSNFILMVLGGARRRCLCIKSANASNSCSSRVVWGSSNCARNFRLTCIAITVKFATSEETCMRLIWIQVNPGCFTFHNEMFGRLNESARNSLSCIAIFDNKGWGCIACTCDDGMIGKMLKMSNLFHDSSNKLSSHYWISSVGLWRISLGIIT